MPEEVREKMRTRSRERLMKIGVVGGGTVGRATARCYVEHAEVRVFDLIKERATHTLEEVLDCDLIFVCLPTPQKEGSLECDLSTINLFFQAVASTGYKDRNYVLRSTVPIGTTKKLAETFPNLVHSPEFLTARCAVTDAQLPARNIIGYPDYVPIDDTSQHPISGLYEQRFPGVQLLKMRSDESEAVKLFQNGFFAVKVSYFNEVRTLANKLKLHWPTVLEGILSDGRIAHSHTKVPGPDGKYGFGGSCLPKDLANLIMCLDSADLLASITMSAYNRNLRDRQR